MERDFSVLNVTKNRLRNKLRDEFMNNCLIDYIERDVIKDVDDEIIMKYFQRMHPQQKFSLRKVMYYFYYDINFFNLL